ncbi:MAG: hypothetical protein SGCHY_004026 [Lobulomycetales sp.]
MEEIVRNALLYCVLALIVLALFTLCVVVIRRATRRNQPRIPYSARRARSAIPAGFVQQRPSIDFSEVDLSTTSDLQLHQLPLDGCKEKSEKLPQQAHLESDKATLPGTSVAIRLFH